MDLPALSRSAVDRASDRRRDADFLAAAWRDPAARAFVVDGDRAFVSGGPEPRLRLQAPDALPPGERLLLGVSGATPYWAVAAALPTAAVPGAARSDAADLTPDCSTAQSLRDVGALLDDREAGLLTHAVALAHWHATHPRCPRCGEPTSNEAGGSMRRCPRDGSEHFPRVDPAVIMLVHDGGDRVVLGRGPAWPSGRYSILAGFVEAGEAAEHAVAREVAEEVGLAVTDIRYAASQPWPFPSSLMLGFTARAAYGELRPAPEELAGARWLTREEVRAGEVGLPSAVSIARWLLQRWLDGALR